MTQMQLPEKFLKTMKQILGEEYGAFLESFDGKRQFGLRVNTAKMKLEEFERIAPFHLSKIPWIADGYFYEEEDAPAKHPFYAAGLYYLQEPSAMTPASRLSVTPGERVLDLCAAPGGKATALGAKLQGEGLLVANDINNARAKALLRNLELFGISNAFVTNEPPHILAEHYPEYFDKIMVDAPCSGEGMFRKNPAVVEAWQEKGPEYFSRLQRDIILHAADMLRPGGRMLYSTCTFSPLENESVITHLLRERPEMEVIPMEDYEGLQKDLRPLAANNFTKAAVSAAASSRTGWPAKDIFWRFFINMRRTRIPICQQMYRPLPVFPFSRKTYRLLPAFPACQKMYRPLPVFPFSRKTYRLLPAFPACQKMYRPLSAFPFSRKTYQPLPVFPICRKTYRPLPAFPVKMRRKNPGKEKKKKRRKSNLPAQTAAGIGGTPVRGWTGNSGRRWQTSLSMCICRFKRSGSTSAGTRSIMCRRRHCLVIRSSGLPPFRPGKSGQPAPDGPAPEDVRPEEKESSRAQCRLRRYIF